MSATKFPPGQVVLLAATVVFSTVVAASAQRNDRPVPKSVSLDAGATEYVPVLSGPPEFRSGLLALW